MNLLPITNVSMAVLVVASSQSLRAQSQIQYRLSSHSQWDGIAKFDGQRHELSKPHGPIHSVPCDPFMSASQEKQLLEILLQEPQSDWPKWLTVREIATDLSKQLPVIVDSRALEEIGIKVDSSTSVIAIENRRSASSQNVEPKPKRWWQGESKSFSVSKRPNLLSLLKTYLESIDLEIVIQHGKLVITTSEQAEEMGIVRLYDVTPLIEEVDRERPASHSQSHMNAYDRPHEEYDLVIETIQHSIDPDRWECLGGNSTIVPSDVRNRKWLVISAPTMTQLKVQALLDRLNQ
ncbi:hypothetical protein LOC67_09090 [Stieleria sp. JC731]|uniref:hypothetical protein n=1 Tax=Pirellulaceae TaxID=2691357 RepID=UPI001E535803|nr:hypothetical protein [Stieleria sp. JC731]MCC9600717.1 hypothetical protein [Stieleria sp. JC731]